MPFVLGPGVGNPTASGLAVATGADAFPMTLPTEHHLALLRRSPQWFHLAVERAVAADDLIVPFARFCGLGVWYGWVICAVVSLVTSVLNTPAPETKRA